MPTPTDDARSSTRLLTKWLLVMALFFAVGWLVLAISGDSGITWAFAISWTLLATGAAWKWHRSNNGHDRRQ